MDEGGERDRSFAERVSRQGGETLARLLEELAANPVVGAALARALEARDKAVQAQETAMGALNIPSASDLERMTRRLRALSQRLEGIEDAVDRLDARLDSLAGATGDADPDGAERLEARLDDIARDLAAVRHAVGAATEPPPRAQERLVVTDS